MPATLPAPQMHQQSAQTQGEGGKGGKKKEKKDKNQAQALGSTYVSGSQGSKSVVAAAGAEAGQAPLKKRAIEDGAMDEDGGDTTKAEAQQDRRRAQLGKINPGLKQLMTALLKSQLSVQQQQRSMSSVLFDTLLVSADLSLIAAMQEQGRAYSEATASGQRDLGPPHIYIYGGLLQALVQEGEKIGALNHATLVEHLKKYEDQPILEKAELVQWCRLDRTYRSDVKRITLSIERLGPARQALLAGLRQVGADLRQGRAPRGALERDLEQWLAALT